MTDIVVIYFQYCGKQINLETLKSAGIMNIVFVFEGKFFTFRKANKGNVFESRCTLNNQRVQESGCFIH